MTALASAQGADQLGNIGALTDGYSAALLGAAGIAIAGGLTAAVTLRRPSGVAPGATSSDQPDRELAPAGALKVGVGLRDQRVAPRRRCSVLDSPQR